MQLVKGMIQVGGTTYRIVRTARAQYDVVRILDDRRVGSFVADPRLRVTRADIDVSTLTEVARSAVRAGRVTWVGQPLGDAEADRLLPSGWLQTPLPVRG